MWMRYVQLQCEGNMFNYILFGFPWARPSAWLPSAIVSCPRCVRYCILSVSLNLHLGGVKLCYNVVLQMFSFVLWTNTNICFTSVSSCLPDDLLRLELLARLCVTLNDCSVRVFWKKDYLEDLVERESSEFSEMSLAASSSSSSLWVLPRSRYSSSPPFGML